MRVSIPLWFDSNPVEATGELIEMVQFQFHSGSIQTLNRLCESRGNDMFQFHSGSIQTVAGKLSEWTFNVVSIPLWFDSNQMPQRAMYCL